MRGPTSNRNPVMLPLPSASQMWAPSPRSMKSGVPPPLQRREPENSPHRETGSGLRQTRRHCWRGCGWNGPWMELKAKLATTAARTLPLSAENRAFHALPYDELDPRPRIPRGSPTSMPRILAGFRERFHMPRHVDATPCITGNSLGLQPVAAAEYIEGELEDAGASLVSKAISRDGAPGWTTTVSATEATSPHRRRPSRGGGRHERPDGQPAPVAHLVLPA